MNQSTNRRDNRDVDRREISIRDVTVNNWWRWNTVYRQSSIVSGAFRRRRRLWFNHLTSRTYLDYICDALSIKRGWRGAGWPAMGYRRRALVLYPLFEGNKLADSSGRSGGSIRYRKQSSKFERLIQRGCDRADASTRVARVFVIRIIILSHHNDHHQPTLVQQIQLPHRQHKSKWRRLFDDLDLSSDHEGRQMW